MGDDVKPSATISLCMIVKDEEKHLPHCLRSVQSLVDEVVVVDTGSTDGTVEVAGNAGAKVFHFEWTGDFSAARNESLRHASGDWVLWLDADERLSLDDPHYLRRLASEGGADAFGVPIRNHKLTGEVDFHHAIRFFRRLPGVQFEKKVHEHVDRHFLRPGRTLAKATFVIEHLGYAAEESIIQVKLERNLQLLEELRSENPNDGFVNYYLALTYMGLNRMQESFEAVRRALDTPTPYPNMRCLMLNLLAYHYLAQENTEAARRCAEESYTLIPVQNAARLLLGMTAYNDGRYQESLAHLLAAYQFQRMPVEKRRTEISQELTYNEMDVLRAVASCCAHLEDYTKAVVFFQKYLAEQPEDADAHLRLGKCFINMGSFGSALPHLLAARNTPGATSTEAILPLIATSMSLGAHDQARECFLELPPERWEEPQALPMLSVLVERHVIDCREKELLDFLRALSLKAKDHPSLLAALRMVLSRLQQASPTLPLQCGQKQSHLTLSRI